MTEPGGGPGQVLDPVDLILRRVPRVWVVPSDEGPRASSQAFNNDRDGGPMSGYLDSLLVQYGLTRGQILDGHAPGEFFVAALTVGFLQSEDQTIVPDPIVPTQHICDPAHVGVAGNKAPGRRSRLARASRWVPGVGPEGGRVLGQ